MEPDLHTVEALNNREFKTYFLNLLSSDLSGEEKYQRLLDFFRSYENGQDVSFALGSPLKYLPLLQETGIPSDWVMDTILAQTADSILRAMRRIRRCQHQDGGWGSRAEESDFWHTGQVALCLDAARRCEELCFDMETECLLQSGYTYLEQHAKSWASDRIEPEGALSTYDLCLMARCFFHGGREFLRRETSVRIYRGIERLYHAQNEDGGWDASLWGYAVVTPTRRFSEVGATAAAMQVLSEVCDDRFVTAMQRAGHWLACSQNLEGSWNDGSTCPDLSPFILTGDPRITKTCDALQGILALRAFDLPAGSYQGLIGRAVDWIRCSQMPVLEKPVHVSGWGWGYTTTDYENTCHALETLLRLPKAPLALLSANACWLVQNQRRQEDDEEDGSWVLGNTPRITAALIQFYHTAHGLFSVSKI